MEQQLERSIVPARLTLSGHAPAPAHAAVEFRPRSVRLTRALLSLLGFWALVPIVFFIPPHMPWALAAFAAGLFFAYRNWAGMYVVHAFEGVCPRCETPITIEPGTRIRLPHAVDCFHCHFHPRLHVEHAS